MVRYTGNDIYDYVTANKLDYLYMMEHHWLLLYGDSNCVPKLLVIASKTNDIEAPYSVEDSKDANNSYLVSKSLKLPFLFIRFSETSENVSVWDSGNRDWKVMHFDDLRNIFDGYEVVQPGTPKKAINQYSSSIYQDWQRDSLGNITVTDLDLVKLNDKKVSTIYELKRSKVPLERWKPYSDDYPNFALIINAIVNAGNDIRFKLIYNLMFDGVAEKRIEKLSRVKFYEFDIPNQMIKSKEVKYNQMQGDDLFIEIN